MDGKNIRRLTEEEEKQSTGLCYKQAVDFVTEYVDANTGKKEKILLVHGNMTPSIGKFKNIEVDHAWVEIGDNVIDPSFNTEIIFEKKEFYERHRVNKERIRKYDHLNMLENIIKTKHYGPWEDF